MLGKLHPRRWRRRTRLSVALLIVATMAGAGSVVGGVAYERGGWIVGIGSGMYGFGKRQPPDWTGLRARWTGRLDVYSWIPTIDDGILLLPTWMPIVLVGGVAAALVRADARRRMVGACEHCGYDLTGLDRGVCPECGAAI